MSEELASQAEQMQATMGYFKTDSGTGKRSSESSGHSNTQREFIHSLSAGPAAPAAAEKPAKPASRASTSASPSVSPAAPVSSSASASKPAKKSDKDSQRLPLSGIHLVLDDDSKASGRDSIDSDFKEF